jgi:ADP-heptose:LPS heptosyltransferase
LKQSFPNAEIHYLSKKPFEGILKSNPYLHTVHTIEKNISEVSRSLKDEDFDFIVDLHNNLRSAHIRLLLNRPSARFMKLNFQKWLLVRFKINTMPARHVVDRYLETVNSLGVKNDGKGLDYFIPTADEVEINTLPATHRAGYVGFVIGAKHNTKQLPVEKLLSVCGKMSRPVILLGGKEDYEKAALIEKELGSRVFNACGKYNLNQSASLVKQAEIIISHDTGLMHIAAAFRKKIFSVWGNTVPDFGFSPYMPAEGSLMLEVKGLSCRPCSKIGYEKCPRGHFKCMRDQDESVFAKL